MLRNLSVFFILCLFSLACLGQSNARGIVGSAFQQNQEKSGETYALIVGVSTYKNKSITPLKYADKDALAFKDFLLASGVKKEKVKVLLNEEAKYAEVMMSLYELCVDSTKSGDVIYFYFSGHGDVESKVITNQGYLLPFDAPTKAYSISALDVNDLQGYAATASAKGVQVIFITDACHAGNLAGGAEGQKYISNILKSEWKDEVKMLSCQPGEISLEAQQWGGGRGLFSFELINGLSGFADKNNDGKVTMLELNLYMMEKVPEQAYPIPQTPILTGNMQKIISRVNKESMAKIKSESSAATFEMVDTKGIEAGLLKGMADSIKLNFEKFSSFLDDDVLVKYAWVINEQTKQEEEVMLPCAYMYYLSIPENDYTNTLKGVMKRNLAVALLDEMNEVLELIATNYWGLFDWDRVVMLRKESFILRSIMGDEKLAAMGQFSNVLLSAAIYASEWDFDKDLVKSAIATIDSSIYYNPNNGLAYSYRGHLNFVINEKLTALKSYKKAIVITPKLSYPYTTMAAIYRDVLQQPDSSLYYLKMWRDACQESFVDFDLKGGSMWLASAFYLNNERDSALYYYNAAINFDSQDHNEIVDDLAIKKSQMQNAIYCLSFLVERKEYLLVLEYAKVLEMKLPIVKEDSACFKENEISMNYYFAICYANLNDAAGALKYLDLYLAAKTSTYQEILEEKSYDSLRNTTGFESLMKKYFRSEYKK